MTLKEILDNALIRLGYTAEEEPELYKMALTKAKAVVNDVYLDLYKIIFSDTPKLLCNYTDTVKLPEKAYGALIYGTAAFVALSCSDADSQSFFMSVYNKKRTMLSKTVTKRQVL